jgi:hypothetical protein
MKNCFDRIRLLTPVPVFLLECTKQKQIREEVVLESLMTWGTGILISDDQRS